MSSSRSTLGQYGVALRAMLVFTVLLGLLYPLLITGIGQLVFPGQANGSLLTVDGEVVGSSLIGQGFTDGDGNTLPEWFQPRPSAAGNGYDSGASSGSNLGPNNDDLRAAIEKRAAAIDAGDAQIPADAVTASGSGLDSHISPDYALLQVRGVAEARGFDEAEVRKLVESMIQGRNLGYMGAETVNVLYLNVALNDMN